MNNATSQPARCRGSGSSSFEQGTKVKEEEVVEIHIKEEPGCNDTFETKYSFEEDRKSEIINPSSLSTAPRCAIDDATSPQKTRRGCRKTGKPTASSTGTRNFKCTTCDKAFSHNFDLTRHMVTHSGVRNFKCDICEKSFSQRWNLKQHVMVTHSGIRSFKCEICEKAFSRNSDLTRHMVIHSGVRSFKCTICDIEAFSQRSHLSQHMLIHSGARNFKCGICDKSFSGKNNLRHHMIAHSGIRSFKCDICEKAFSRKNELLNHMVIHSGIKNFKCNICEKSFSRKDQGKDCLSQHMVIHSGARSFKCANCEMAFSRKDYLSQHMVTNHSNLSSGSSSQSFQQETEVKKEEAVEIHVKEEPCSDDIFETNNACEKLFSREDRLSKHMVTQHPNLSSGPSIQSFQQETEVKKEEVVEIHVKDEPGCDDIFEAKYHFEEEQRFSSETAWPPAEMGNEDVDAALKVETNVKEEFSFDELSS